MKLLQLLVLVLPFVGFSQFQKLEVRLTNAPSNVNDDFIVIKEFYGNDFRLIHRQELPNDTLINISIVFATPTKTGLYQLFIEDPREKESNKVELILNPAEKPQLEARYFELKNGILSISSSVENQAYSDLIAIKNYYQPELQEARIARLSQSPFQADFKKKSLELELSTELIQANFNDKLVQITDIYPNTFTSRILIPQSLIPVRSSNIEWSTNYDSYLSFLHKNYFHFVDFDNSELLRHYAFADNLFYYFNDYSVKNDIGAKSAIDVIMSQRKENEEINSFTYNYLLSNFLKLENEELTMYLVNTYGSSCSLNLSFEELKKLNTIQSLTIGGQAPEISLPDQAGTYQSLRAYCSKNDYTVVFMWLSWCSRCQKEIPELLKIQQKFKSKKLGFYLVSLDEKREDWLAKSTQFDKSWINVSELVAIPSSSIVKNYNISTTPAIYILDKNGKVIEKDLYNQNLENFFNSLYTK